MKKTFIHVLLTLLLCGGKELEAQMPDSVRTYIDSAIFIMQTKALNGKNLDWKKIRDSAYAKARGAQHFRDAFPALAYAFQQL